MINKKFYCLIPILSILLPSCTSGFFSKDMCSNLNSFFTPQVESGKKRLASYTVPQHAKGIDTPYEYTVVLQQEGEENIDVPICYPFYGHQSIFGEETDSANKSININFCVVNGEILCYDGKVLYTFSKEEHMVLSAKEYVWFSIASSVYSAGDRLYLMSCTYDSEENRPIFECLTLDSKTKEVLDRKTSDRNYYYPKGIYLTDTDYTYLPDFSFDSFVIDGMMWSVNEETNALVNDPYFIYSKPQKKEGKYSYSGLWIENVNRNIVVHYQQNHEFGSDSDDDFVLKIGNVNQSFCFVNENATYIVMEQDGTTYPAEVDRKVGIIRIQDGKASQFTIKGQSSISGFFREGDKDILEVNRDSYYQMNTDMDSCTFDHVML